MASIPTGRTEQPRWIHSPWGRQVKPFSSLRKKMADLEEEKESHEKRNSKPFSPVREDKPSKKRNRRLQRSRKYRKLDMGHSMPTTGMSICLTTTTTSTASLSAPVPSGFPSTSNILSIPKPPAQRPPYKTWAICHPTPALISPQIHTDWASDG